MKLIFKIMFCLFFIAANVEAQISTINNSPDKSAALDIRMPKKGLLIPRVNLQNVSDKASIAGGSPAQGLWVYNTNTSLPNGTGYYYWESSSWKKMADLTEAKDNLGNHIAQQNLKMGNNYINNDGGANEGLNFNTAGDATFMQQLAIKDVPSGTKDDKILTVGTDGLIKQQTKTAASSTAVAFFKYSMSADKDYSTGNSKIKFDTKNIDKSNIVGSVVDNSGAYSVFRAPKAGYYFIEYSISQRCPIEGNSIAKSVVGNIMIIKEPSSNIAMAQNYYYAKNATTFLTQTLGTILYLNLGDKLSIQFDNAFGKSYGATVNNTRIGGNPDGNDGASYFSGYFISD
ncbi:hypothetical protein [uncultured Flavobacterium sp.]|uniref:hypothetical protein n=1 Tax=uncultured Flavobacterium sp. TaxID=165435 RepID=UPI0029307756|nr:hypothetical protein [uncultured Flavobacterium sp.]